MVHVEAGLRSFDRSMPEEVNRILTDRLSSLLFVTEPSGVENLKREGVDEERIHLVGNVMIDTLERGRSLAEKESQILDRLQLQKKKYAVMTLHRPSNVDFLAPLQSILSAVKELSREIPIVWALHPRSKKRIEEFQLNGSLDGVKTLPPLPYLDMLQLMDNAKLVLTDSGGIQEETNVLQVPCLTLRNNTERPITLENGANILVGSDQEKILDAARKVFQGEIKPGNRPEFWDGRAASRIASILEAWTPRHALSNRASSLPLIAISP